MSEWLKEHAWKSTPLARADAYEIPPTHSRSTTSRNIDTRRHVLVNHRIDRGFEGVCDTVLTQRDASVASLQQPWRSVPLGIRLCRLRVLREHQAPIIDQFLSR